MAGFGGRPETSSYFQYREAVVEPRGEARPDTQIIFDLAARLGLGDAFWDGDVQAAFRHQLAPSGITLEELRARPEGVHVAQPVQHRKYAGHRPDGTVAGFKTPTARIEIYSERFREHGYDPLPAFEGAAWERQSRAPGGEAFPLILTTGKVSAYLHSGGRGIPTLRRRHPQPFVEIHPSTAKEHGISGGSWVEVSTHRASLRAKARVTSKVRPGVVATQTGWWEACEELGLPAHDPFGDGGANLNHVVTNELIDPISGSVPGKSYACAIAPLAGAPREG
jgi:anaerobic selenocysteine-containing dehydrogenase